MKILMLAPEPFFQPRGTPISVYFRNKALSDLGHKIDLITYPLGSDVDIENLKIFRVPNFLRLKKIKIGPSLSKVPLDAALTLKAGLRLLDRSYDLIYSHEEAALPGVILSRMRRIPHVYDMHSSLPQQLDNFKVSKSPFLKRLFSALERFVLRNSQAVIVICPALLEKVKEEGYGQKSILIENFIDFPCPETSPEKLADLRRTLAPAGEKIILYAGNFGPYQGIQLLLQAMAFVREKAVLVLLGGSSADQANIKKQAALAGLSERVVLLDRVPPSEVPLYVVTADVLVSPRIAGTNTPLKIYSLLKSGKPLVATNLNTHTQVLNDRISILVEPTAEAMAAGLSFALANPEAQRRARMALEFAEKEYTYPAYLEKIGFCLQTAVKNFKG